MVQEKETTTVKRDGSKAKAIEAAILAEGGPDKANLESVRLRLAAGKLDFNPSQFYAIRSRMQEGKPVTTRGNRGNNQNNVVNVNTNLFDMALLTEVAAVAKKVGGWERLMAIASHMHNVTNLQS